MKEILFKSMTNKNQQDLTRRFTGSFSLALLSVTVLTIHFQRAKAYNLSSKT